MSDRFPRPETHSQLVNDPFASRIEPRLLFRHPAFAAAFDGLYSHVLERKGVALLLGAPGVGKTALLGCLRDRFFIGDHVTDPGPYAVLLNDDDPSRLSIDRHITRLLVSDTGVDPRWSREETLQDDENLQLLTGKLMACARRKLTVALLIDDAQKLTEAVVRNLHMLSALREGRHPLLQVILAGTPDLQERLELAADVPAAQSFATRIRLTGLDRRDVGRYVEHRMCLAGLGDGGVFTAEAVERIAAHSDGVPLRIDKIAGTALRIAGARSSDAVTADMVDRAAADCARELAALAGKLASRPPQAAVALIDRTRMKRSGPAGRSAPAVNPLADRRRPVVARRRGRGGRIAALSALALGSALAGIAIGAYWATGELPADVGFRQLAAVRGWNPAREAPGVPDRPSPRPEAPAALAPHPTAAEIPTERPVQVLDPASGREGPAPVQVHRPASLASGSPGREEHPEPWGEGFPGTAQQPSVALPQPSTPPAAVVAAQAEPTGQAAPAELSPAPPAAAPEPDAEEIRQPTADIAPAPAAQAGSAEDEPAEAAGETEKTETPPGTALPAVPAADAAMPPAETEVTGTASPEIVSPPQTLLPPALPPETAAPVAASAAPAEAAAAEAAAPTARDGAEPVAAAPHPAAPAVEAPALQRMITRGDALLSTGDVVSARLFYELAAAQGSAAAATMVGKTYDPFFLGEANINGAQANPAKAAEWYRKAIAIEGGSSDAAARLQRLTSRLRR